MPDQHPTLAEYDDYDVAVEAGDPQPDPRVVALQALVDAEAARQSASDRLEVAEQNDRDAELRLREARSAYVDAMAETKLR